MVAILYVSIHYVKVKTKHATTWLQIRVTRAKKSEIKTMAAIYAGGNMSAYILYCESAAPRKFLNKKEPRRKRRGSFKQP